MLQREDTDGLREACVQASKSGTRPVVKIRSIDLLWRIADDLGIAEQVADQIRGRESHRHSARRWAESSIRG